MNFFAKTVDAVLEDFHKVINKLEAVAQHHTDQEQKKITDANDLIGQANAHKNEAAYAKAVADKMTALVS